MRKIVRGVLAVILGFVAFSVVVMIGENIGHMIFPIPGGLNPSDPESIKAVMEKLPVGALVAVVVAWGVGAFAGAWVAARLAPGSKLIFGLAIGVLGLFATVGNMLLIPHPTWMWVLGIAELLPAAYLGARLATPSMIRRSPGEPASRL